VTIDIKSKFKKISLAFTLRRTDGVTGSNVERQTGPLAAAECLKHSEMLTQPAPGQQITAADQKITNRDYRLIYRA
jgi:hypothetical protein